MTNQDKNEIGHIVEDFLIDHPSPKNNDWKALIDAHPEYAGTIADAALANRGSVELEAAARDWPLNQSAFDKTISFALNLVHQVPSPLLEEAKQRVAAIQGPTVKKVAVELDIGPYPSLLSGVLVGRTHAPKRLLKALAAKLEVSPLTLVELFKRTFSASEIPAFKSPNGKPQLAAQPSTWKQAVIALDLPPEETARLLKLSDKV